MLSHLDVQDDSAVMAALHWSAVCGDLLGGLTHALSNRVAFLTILSSHLSADVGAIEASAGMLRDECTKLTTVLDLMRLLSYPGQHNMGPAEPMSLAECLDEAVALLQHNRIGRETPLAVTGAAGLPAVWGQRIEARRALVTLLFAVQRDATKAKAERGKGGERRDETITLSCQADADAVTVEIRAPDAELESRRAFWATVVHFTRAAGAELCNADGNVTFGEGDGVDDVLDGPIVFRMPTMAAGRAAAVG